jgi:hypothetical protein
VILLVGGQTTSIAGTVALTHHKPMIAIATFGGAAQDIWKELTPETGILEQAELDRMNVRNWAPNIARELVQNLLTQRQRLQTQLRTLRDRDLEHDRRQRTAPVPLTWDNPALGRILLISLLFASPLFSGISGATTRTGFETFANTLIREPPPLLNACGLGAVAGLIAGCLFITAQLVAMSPEIGDQVWSKQAGRLVPFASLVGFIGGLTLDAVFRKLSGIDVISVEALKTALNVRAPEDQSQT